jgi:hypothetical protein
MTVHRGLVAIAVFVLLLACGADRACAQECPQIDANGDSSESEIRTLRGLLIFHDGVRQWFELRMDRPECGDRSIQLMKSDDKSRSIEVLRGCHVVSTGRIAFSPTGYYSLNTFQNVEKIAPEASCVRQKPLPDAVDAKPDKLIRAYTVNMHLYDGAADQPIIFHVWGAGRELRPWQAYVSYLLTGGRVLYGHCAEGFVVDKIFGPKEADPMHFLDPKTPGDMAAFNPEGAAAMGKRDLHLGYTCIRGN